MNRNRRKLGVLLLAVFSAILLSPLFQTPAAHRANIKEITVIQAQEYSGNATENISRSFASNGNFESRVTQDFTCQVLQTIHSSLSHASYTQVRSHLVQHTPTIKVYKRIQQFLI